MKQKCKCKTTAVFPHFNDICVLLVYLGGLVTSDLFSNASKAFDSTSCLNLL